LSSDWYNPARPFFVHLHTYMSHGKEAVLFCVYVVLNKIVLYCLYLSATFIFIQYNLVFACWLSMVYLAHFNCCGVLQGMWYIHMTRPFRDWYSCRLYTHLCYDKQCSVTMIVFASMCICLCYSQNCYLIMYSLDPHIQL
jgi:hypothetical protein